MIAILLLLYHERLLGDRLPGDRRVGCCISPALLSCGSMGYYLMLASPRLKKYQN